MVEVVNSSWFVAASVGFNPAHSGAGNPPRYLFEMMEQCVDCGEWKPVDRLTVDFDDPEERPFCAIGCSVDV